MSKPRGRFYPDPPECLSQIWGAQRQDAYMRHSEALREAGRTQEADDAYVMALYYGGFRRLVR